MYKRQTTAPALLAGLSGLAGSLHHAVRRAAPVVLRLARRLFRMPWKIAAVCDLFWRHAREKGGSFLWAGRYGALRWGVDRRTADRIVLELEERGHLHVVDRGDRHTPRTVQMHLLPLENVDLSEIRKARLEICRRYNAGEGCSHSTSLPAPPLPSHPPFSLNDDPSPCWSAVPTPDPLQHLLSALFSDAALISWDAATDTAPTDPWALVSGHPHHPAAPVQAAPVARASGAAPGLEVNP